MITATEATQKYHKSIKKTEEYKRIESIIDREVSACADAQKTKCNVSLPVCDNVVYDFVIAELKRSGFTVFYSVRSKYDIITLMYVGG